MAAQRERDSDKNEGTGGGFGKFRKRPVRKSAATPYARPPAALGASSGGGWVSKLVDPAQKLLTSGAQRFFASVFRKRLTNTSPQPSYAPTVEPAPKPATETSEGGAIVLPFSVCSVGKPVSSENLKNNIEKDSISHLEEALQQHTFTRSEVERLTNLLQSKIVDHPSVEPKPIPKTTQLALPVERNDASHIPAGDIYRGNIATSISNTSGVNGLLEDVASPTELAKAFMDGRPSYAFPSKMSSFKPSLLKEQSHAIASTSHSPKSSSMAIIPSSSDQGGFQQNATATPRSIGRSALYGMVRTPYSRSIWSNNSQGPRTPLSSLVGASSSFHESGKNSRSVGSKPESLKRRSSVIENDVDAGNIRRIRQKSNLLPSSGIHSSGSSRFSIETKSTKGKSVVTFDPHAKSTNDNGPASKFNPVPSKSSEMASKILQQLDTLVSSREKSPAKLSQSMLRGPALRSLENVEPPKLLLDDYHDGLASHQENSLPVHKAKLADDDCERSVVKRAMVSFNKSVVQDVGPSNGRTTASGLSKTLSMVEAPATSVKRRAFQMSAHEDCIELDDDDYANVSVEKEKETNAPGNNVTDLIGSNKSLLLESQENVENNNIFAGPSSATVNPLGTVDKETPAVFGKSSPPKPVSTTSLISVSAPEPNGTKPSSPIIPENSTSKAHLSSTDSMKGPVEKVYDNDNFQSDSLKVSEVPSASSSLVTSSIFSFDASASNSSLSNGSLASNSMLLSSTSTASSLGPTTSSPAASFFKFGPPVPQSPSSGEALLTASEPAKTKINGFQGSTILPSNAPVSEVNASVAMGSSSFSPSSVFAPTSFGDTSTAATSTSGIFGSSISSAKPSSVSFGGASTISAPADLSNSSPSTSIFGGSSDAFSSSSTSTVLFGASGGLSSSSSLASSPIFGASSGATSFSSSPFPLFNPTSAATTTNSSTVANSSTGSSIFSFNSGTTTLTSNQFPFNSFTSSTQSSSSSSTSAPFQFSSSISPTLFGSTPFSSSGSVSTSVFNSTWQAPNSSSSPTGAFTFDSSSASKTAPFPFGSPIPAQQFGSSEHTMEDNMAEDTVHASTPHVFNQQPMSHGFAFGSTNASSNQVGAPPPFQFGSQASPSPFQATGSLDFQGSGSFSLGASGGEKATRRIVKVRKSMRKR